MIKFTLMKKLILGFAMMLMMQACSEKIGIQSIVNTKWVLTEWPNQIMPNTEKKALLNFGTDDSVSGKSFCNSFGGKATISGRTIKFSELMGTKMFCEDVGQAESKYTEGLRSANSFNVIGNKLQLLNGDKLLMVFSKAE